MIRFKKIFFSIVFLFCSISLLAQDLPPKPNPIKFVNDYTNTLTADQIQGIESKLFELDKRTSTEIVVVIVKNTNGRTIADYNVDLLRNWGVGGKKNNNGVILLISKEKRELDITVGYGLEGSLTDATAKSIIDDIIVPQFKGQDYYRGVNDGVDAIYQAVQGKYQDRNDPTSNSGGGSNLIFIIFLVMIVLFFLARRGGGGNGGAYMSRRGGRSIADAIFWNTILNSGGGRGGGGFFDGGGSSGGGGFGDFGGGSGGGGGASGSW